MKKITYIYIMLILGLGFSCQIDPEYSSTAIGTLEPTLIETDNQNFQTYEVHLGIHTTKIKDFEFIEVLKASNKILIESDSSSSNHILTNVYSIKVGGVQTGALPVTPYIYKQNVFLGPGDKNFYVVRFKFIDDDEIYRSNFIALENTEQVVPQ